MTARTRSGSGSLSIAVAGGTGMIGRRLVAALTERGHRARVLSRRHQPAFDLDADGAAADADRSAALSGAEVAYYLVHGLERPDFAVRDSVHARRFGSAAATARVGRIVYLGGLGTPPLSDHLASRRAVESDLAAGGVQVVALRAGMVIGAGGASWELARQLATRAQLLAVPLAAAQRTQPIGLDDVCGYLADAAELTDPASVYEVGGADVLTFAELLMLIGRLAGGRPPVLLPVPVRAAPQSWMGRLVASVTDVDPEVAVNLLKSMTTPTVVTDQAARRDMPREPMDFRTAARRALAEAGNGLG